MDWTGILQRAVVTAVVLLATFAVIEFTVMFLWEAGRRSIAAALRVLVLMVTDFIAFATLVIMIAVRAGDYFSPEEAADLIPRILLGLVFAMVMLVVHERCFRPRAVTTSTTRLA